MSFRKRNIGISQSSSTTSTTPTNTTPQNPASISTTPQAPPGTRPSPLDGRTTTSTGTPSLDSLLAGHAGLPLGFGLLIEENGTTDYAAPLLKHYAAEGIVQGHVLHVVGVGDGWVKELPGLVVGGGEAERERKESSREREKMKIAWRYERLAGGGDGAGAGAGRRAPVAVDRSPHPNNPTTPTDEPAMFCHTFDLAKRMNIPTSAQIHHHAINTTSSQTSPFAATLQKLVTLLQSSTPTTTTTTTTTPTTIHRIVIPSLLSPALYPPQASTPYHLLQFIHALRALLRLYPQQLTFLASLPLTLYPRTSGLIRTMEHLCDGVLELTPFPHAMDEGLSGNPSSSLATSGAATAMEERPQGLLAVHKLPVLHERGGGGGGLKGWGDDLAFTVSRRRFVITPFSLPPAEGDTDAQRGEAEGGKLTKEKMEF